MLFFAVLVALLVDIIWGEPPVAFHPVVWIGKYLEVAGNWAAPSSAEHGRSNDARAFIRGAFGWTVGAVAIVSLFGYLQQQSTYLPIWAEVLFVGFLLKTQFAWRMLLLEVQEVELALQSSLALGRDRLSWLCSRDVSGLDSVGVRETAIETLSENLCDSVVAPLFWFAVAGLPGAALYRFANTADAMWGYRGFRNGKDWEWAGKCAARIDDLLSWVPARLTALMLILASGRFYLSALGREAERTPSPNGGWPMGAMALLLNIKLGKAGVYTIHEAGTAAGIQDTYKACALASRVVWLIVPLCGAAAWVGYA